MTRKSPSQTGRVFIALMMALFIIVLLAMSMFGAKILKGAYSQKTSGETARLGQSLIANTIHANDSVNAVKTAEGPEGPALVLVERTDYGTFETRLYQYEGKIVEEYALAESDINPASATEMVKSQSFSFALQGSLLSVTTDQGTTTVALRCAQEPQSSLLAEANASQAQVAQEGASQTQASSAQAQTQANDHQALPNQGGAA